MPTTGTQTATKYLDAALALLQERAYPLQSVHDWDVIRQKARIMTASSSRESDTYRAIRMVLEDLGYSRSCLIPPTENATNSDSAESIVYGFDVLPDDNSIAYILPGSPAEDVGLEPGDRIVGTDYNIQENPTLAPNWTKSTEALRLVLERPATNEHIFALVPARHVEKISPARVHAIGNTGYIEIIVPPNPQLNAEYISAMHQAIRDLDNAAQIKGWVVDLRRCNGEDLALFLAILCPFLGDEGIGELIEHDGRSHVWRCHDNQIFFGEEQVAALPEDYTPLDCTGSPIAILTSSLTRAAAEMAVVAFCGREKTRRFGEATFGNPLYQERFSLSDGASMLIATRAPADRTGKKYVGSIEPDETIPIRWDQFGTESDPVLQAALRWL